MNVQKKSYYMFAKFSLKKLIPFLLISVVFSTSSWGQGQPFVVAPPAGTPLVSGTPFQSINGAGDKYGNIFVSPQISGTPNSFPVSGGPVNVVATPGATSFLKSMASGSYAASDNGVAQALLAGAMPAAQESGATTGRYAVGKRDLTGNMLVRTAQGITFTTTTPSITTATSFTTLAANNNRVFYRIQNNSSANICCSENNATLTGIVPTATNICEVLTPGSSIQSPPNATPVAAITCYQTSGVTLNNVVVVEGAAV